MQIFKVLFKKHTHYDGNIESAHQWSPVLHLCNKTHNAPPSNPQNTNTHQHSITRKCRVSSVPFGLADQQIF